MRTLAAYMIAMSLLALGLLLCSGRSGLVPGTFPVPPAGTVPTASQIAQETSSTTALRNDVALAEEGVAVLAIAGALPPADLADAQTVAADLDAEITAYDSAYAAGQAPTYGTLNAAIVAGIADIAALKSPAATPAKAAAKTHALAIRAASIRRR